jgi:predicted RND superfamily exporter protein
MEHIANFIVNKRKAIIAVFVVLTLVCAPLAFLTKVNYDVLDYLPTHAQSTQAINIMNKEFADDMPNTEVMISNLSVSEALEYKQKLTQVKGVTSVMWLDDVVDVRKPLELADQDTVEQYYKERAALFQVTIEEGSEQETVKALLELAGPDNAVGGNAASVATMQDAAVNEVTGAFFILIPAIIIILALSTSSWLEPLLLLLSIGVAIILNMGTNIIYDDVSFITNSVSPILQLAVSLDYAIFLLHSFADHRKQYSNVNIAMKHAVKDSFSTVASSASTTLFGFLALVFMEFLIGADLGINLAKGVIFSFLSATIFLPALTLGVYKLVDRTQHRPLLPSFENIHRVLSKVAVPVAIVVILAIVPTYLGQSRTDFLYGSESAGVGSRSQIDSDKIDKQFGTNNLVVALVPRGDVAKEQQLSESLLKLDHVTNVMSYARTIGPEIPPDILSSAVKDQFYSENYARLLVYVDLPVEGTTTFDTMGKIYETEKEYYGDGA